MSSPEQNLNDPERKIQPIHSPRPLQNVNQHLSNERTYLAYIRTAIALISFGVTINRFSLFLIQSKLITRGEGLQGSLVNVQRAGLGMVIFGIILVVWAVLHYRNNRRQIDRGDFHPDLGILYAIAFVIVAGGGLSLLWLFHR
jgi:putative membrane protein